MPREIEVKTILNKTKRRDPWFLDDYSVNLYSSCSFNCLYCYIRGSKYGNNLESSLSVKTNAIELLNKQLSNRAKKGQHGIIVLSSATDPYLKIEQKYELTRQALEVILKYRFPVHMITKSDGIERDFDLLQKIHREAILPNDLIGRLSGGTLVSFSFSSLDDKVGRIFEPGAPPPSKRLVAVEKSLEAGLPTGINLMPLLPWISDTTASLEEFFRVFAKLKVDYVLPATISLFGNSKADSKTLVLKAVAKHYPDLLSKYEQYFASGTTVPQFYHRAFNEKMKSLAQASGLPNSIGLVPQKRQ